MKTITELKKEILKVVKDKYPNQDIYGINEWVGSEIIDFVIEKALLTQAEEVEKMIDRLEIRKQKYGLGLKDRVKYYVLWKDIERLKEEITGEEK